MKSSSNSKGFTLIELLVVISIISLLSSIVIASLKVARDKARIAGGQKYATHVVRTESDRAAIIWRMDEGSGSTLNDASGQGNNGTIAGATWSSDAVGGKMWSLDFNGSSSFVYNSFVSSKGVQTSQGYTIMAWIKPRSYETGGHQVIAGKYLPYFSLYDKALFFRNFIDGSWADVTSPSGIVPLDEWTHVAAVFTDDNYSTIIVNGKEVARTGPFTGAHYNCSGCMGNGFIVGAWLAGSNSSTLSNHFDGKIDEVYFINKALGIAEIEKIYAEGAHKFITEK